MKKIIFILLLLISLCACQKEPIEEVVEDKYINSLNEINYYNELNDELKSKLEPIYGLNGAPNFVFDLIGSDLINVKTQDYYGNEIDFKELRNQKLIIEIVQYTCEHCLKQVPLSDEIVKSDDITFIQFFAFGTIEQIDEFYAKANEEIPDNIIVIPEDKNISNYYINLGIDATPTFLFYENGSCLLAKTAELSLAQYQNVKKVCYENKLDKNDLTTNDGKSIFDVQRTYNDVLADLTAENKNKLALIPNAEQLTIETIGKYVEFYTLYDEEEGAIYKIDSYTKYVNKPLVVFYLGDINDNLVNDINLINVFVTNHKDVKVLTIFMDNKDLSTSLAYQEIDDELLSDYVSSNALIPQIFVDTKVHEYPAVLFIQDNVINGGYYKVNDIDTLEFAYKTFIGDESIALIANNQKQ